MNANRPRIYLDHHATTPVDRGVLEAMLPHFDGTFGNPSSRTHAHGDEAAAAVRRARRQVATFLGASVADEILFTSGATEANNLALRGVVDARRQRGAGPIHIITSAIEHPSVTETARYLRDRGAAWTQVGVDPRGVVSLPELEAAIRPDTALISVMAVNNEVGTIQPVARIGAIARRHGIPFHCDATQAAGRIPLDVDAARIDLLSLSAHKVYGPKGVGALYCRRIPAPVELAPLLQGGGQERGLRAGTLNVPGIVGLGEALTLADRMQASEHARLETLTRRALDGLRRAAPDLVVHGDGTPRVPGSLNVRFPGVPADALLNAVPHLSLSGGSACASSRPGASPTLAAMGIAPGPSREAIRMGMGRGTTETQVDEAVRSLTAAAHRLRRNLP